MRDHYLKPVFTIPNEYFKRFIYVHDELTMKVTADGKRGDIHFETFGEPKTYGPELDWIQEAIETIRFECKNGVK